VIANGPAPGRWTGRPDIAKGIRGWLSAWEDFRVEEEEYRELDDERVLLLVVFDGSGKTSGLEIGETRSQGASLFRVRNGKVTKSVQYWDREPRPRSGGVLARLRCVTAVRPTRWDHPTRSGACAAIR
jgi:hypothetical protein